MRRSPFMDYCAQVWQRIGQLFKVRPATVIGVTLGAIIFASTLTYVLVRQENNNQQLSEIRAAFCSGTNPDPVKCRQLFDALLKNPTPSQAKRLKEIIGD